MSSETNISNTESDELALLLREAEKSEVQVVNGDVFTNAVDVALKTGSLDFQIHAQTNVTAEAIDLAARLDATTKLLNESNAKLEAAMYRIGFLESKTEQLESKIEKLESPQQLEHTTDPFEKFLKWLGF